MIPINMAFFYYSTPDQRMLAMYPESGRSDGVAALAGELERDRAGGIPNCARWKPDVEALLVNRIGHSRGFAEAEYYLLPIDQCFKLVGLIRSHWRGFSGGTEVWQQIGGFFADLKAGRHGTRRARQCLI